MKKVFLSLLLLSLFHLASIGQDVYIYNSKGDKIYFQTNPNIKYFKFTNTLTVVQKQNVLTTFFE